MKSLSDAKLKNEKLLEQDKQSVSKLKIKKQLKKEQNKQNEIITIVTNVDSENAPYLSGLINSLSINLNWGKAYQLFIFSNDLFKKYENKFEEFSQENLNIHIIRECEEVSNDIKQGINESLAFKIFASKYLSGLDKFIYLPYDCIVHGDLADLFDIDINNAPFAAVREYDMNGTETGNFEVGTMLINPKIFNNFNLKELVFDSKKKISEKTLLNKVFQNQVIFLDNKWGFRWDIPYMYLNGEIETRFKILHFASKDKPWTNPSHQYADLFWEYVRETSLYEEILFKNLSRLSNVKQQVKGENTFVEKRSLLSRFKCGVRDIGFWKTITKGVKKIFKKGGNDIDE